MCRPGGLVNSVVPCHRLEAEVRKYAVACSINGK
jgi:hypothetical protein